MAELIRGVRVKKAFMAVYEEILSPGRESNPDFLQVQPVAKFTTGTKLPGSKSSH
jgi:hypothetical protein